MAVINSVLDNLNITTQYKDYIIQAIYGLCQFEFIKKLYLFGSCAKGMADKYSDIDLLVVTDGKISDKVICNEVMDTLPEVRGSELYSDTIFLSEDEVAKNINTPGHISRVIVKESVDLSELLRQCRIEKESR